MIAHTNIRLLTQLKQKIVSTYGFPESEEPISKLGFFKVKQAVRLESALLEAGYDFPHPVVELISQYANDEYEKRPTRCGCLY